MIATRRGQKPGLTAARNMERVKKQPPARISALRRRISERMPRTGSMKLPRTAGIVWRRPIWMYESPRSRRISGHAVSKTPPNSSSRNSIASRVKTNTGIFFP
jgi:hypothetical protein